MRTTFTATHRVLFFQTMQKISTIFCIVLSTLSLQAQCDNPVTPPLVIARRQPWHSSHTTLCHCEASAVAIQSYHLLSLRGVSRGNPVIPSFVIARRQPWQSSHTTFCHCEASAVAIQSHHPLSLRGVSRGNPVIIMPN